MTDGIYAVHDRLFMEGGREPGMNSCAECATEIFGFCVYDDGEYLCVGCAGERISKLRHALEVVKRAGRLRHAQFRRLRAHTKELERKAAWKYGLIEELHLEAGRLMRRIPIGMQVYRISAHEWSICQGVLVLARGRTLLQALRKLEVKSG